MKIIVATTMFVRQIRMALDNKTRSFEINTQTEQIICVGNKKVQLPIRMAVGNRGMANDGGTFDPVIWYQMMMFLRHLEEQPIVIEISGGNEPTFELKQFVKKF